MSLIFIPFLAVSCSEGAKSEPILQSEPVAFKVEVVAEGLEVPWGIAVVPDGRVFVTERVGRVRVIKDGKLQPMPLATLEQVVSQGEGGLMDISLHPKFSENRFVYLSYVVPGEVRVVRYRETENSLVEPTVIVKGVGASMFHAGCRARFGPDGKLYVTTGEQFEGHRAQDLRDLCGKTLRVNDDGSIPSDNPFVGRSDARPEIWSYGHRNAQGLAWQPGSGLMFQTEHGPSGSDGPGGGDEVNIVEKGLNYGWPVVHHRATRAGMVSPLLEYTPAVAPCGAMFYSGKMFPQWKGDFFFANLRGERVIRVQLDGRKVVTQNGMFQGEYGRIRDIAEGPDGSIYFCNSNQDGRGDPSRGDDRLFRIVKR